MSAQRRAGRPQDVLDLIEDGADLIVPFANGEPVSVLDAIEANTTRFRNVRVHQMHALHDRPYLHGAYRDHLLHVSYFLSPVTRPAFHERGCEFGLRRAALDGRPRRGVTDPVEPDPGLDGHDAQEHRRPHRPE